MQSRGVGRQTPSLGERTDGHIAEGVDTARGRGLTLQRFSGPGGQCRRPGPPTGRGALRHWPTANGALAPSESLTLLSPQRKYDFYQVRAWTRTPDLSAPPQEHRAVHSDLADWHFFALLFPKLCSVEHYGLPRLWCPRDSHKAHVQLKAQRSHLSALHSCHPRTLPQAPIYTLQCQLAIEHLSGNAAMDQGGKGHLDFSACMDAGPTRFCGVLDLGGAGWYIRRTLGLCQPYGLAGVFSEFHGECLCGLSPPAPSCLPQFRPSSQGWLRPCTPLPPRVHRPPRRFAHTGGWLDLWCRMAVSSSACCRIAPAGGGGEGGREGSIQNFPKLRSRHRRKGGYPRQEKEQRAMNDL